MTIQNLQLTCLSIFHYLPQAKSEYPSPLTFFPPFFPGSREVKDGIKNEIQSKACHTSSFTTELHPSPWATANSVRSLFQWIPHQSLKLCLHNRYPIKDLLSPLLQLVWETVIVSNWFQSHSDTGLYGPYVSAFAQHNVVIFLKTGQSQIWICLFPPIGHSDKSCFQSFCLIHPF